MIKKYLSIPILLSMCVTILGAAESCTPRPSACAVAATTLLASTQSTQSACRAINVALPAKPCDRAEIELLRATAAGDVDAVSAIITYGYDGTKLHNINAAVSLSQGPRALLTRYKLTSYTGLTPLMIAIHHANQASSCDNKYYKIIQILLEHGADYAHIRAFGDKQRRTAVDFVTNDHLRTFIDSLL